MDNLKDGKKYLVTVECMAYTEGIESKYFVGETLGKQRIFVLPIDDVKSIEELLTWPTHPNALVLAKVTITGIVHRFMRSTDARFTQGLWINSDGGHYGEYDLELIEVLYDGTAKG